MKWNLSSSFIIAMLISTGLTACDDKKESKSDSQVVEQKAKKVSSKPTQAVEEYNDNVLNKKLNIYINCYNNLQVSIYRAIKQYNNTFHDVRIGPTGKENNLSPLMPVSSAIIESCQKNIKNLAALKPTFNSLDSAAVTFINAAYPLANTINKMNEYYSQSKYKSDNFSGAKEFHNILIKQFDAFDPAAKVYIKEITMMSRQHSVNAIKITEKKEGKSVKYYTLLTMLEAEIINNSVAGNSFNAESMAKQLSAFEKHTQQLNEKIKTNVDKYRSFPGFIAELEKFQSVVKQRILRVRDKVVYTELEKNDLANGRGERVEGSYVAVSKTHSDLIHAFNGYHLEREF